MPNIFESDRNTAIEQSSNLDNKGSNIGEIDTIFGGQTNLSVIRQIGIAITELNNANEAYKNLLNKDAKAIKDIQNEYDELDNRIKEKMGFNKGTN